jgi:hypothetical protein
MGSPTMQALQDPILLLPWVCFRGGGFSNPLSPSPLQGVACELLLRSPGGAVWGFGVSGRAHAPSWVYRRRLTGALWDTTSRLTSQLQNSSTPEA